MSEKLVSIIVPCYNAASYLDECLASLCGQTHQNLEIILVDDGSTDGTAALCEIWAKKDKRVSMCQSNHEGPSCRNEGLCRATGDYLTFVDSDDVLDVRFVEKMLDAAAECPTAMALCSYKRLSEEGVPLSVRALGVTGVFDEERFCALLLEDVLYPSVWGKLYPVQALKSVRFRKGRVGEDVFFWADVLADGSIKQFAIIDEPLYGYRQRAGSIIHEFDAVQDAVLLDAWDALGKVARTRFRSCIELAEYREIQARFFLIDRALRVMPARDYAQFDVLRRYISSRFKSIMKSSHFGIRRKVMLPLMVSVPALYGIAVKRFK